MASLTNMRHHIIMSAYAANAALTFTSIAVSDAVNKEFRTFRLIRTTLHQFGEMTYEKH